MVPDQTEALARHVTVPVLAVDGNTIVPLARLQGQGPAVTTAAHLRPRIHRDFADAWEHRASATPRVPRVARSSLLPFPVADLGDVDGLLARLPVDRSVSAVVGMPGGTVAARRRLEEFLARRLTGYAESRSEPSPPEAGHQSGLSPYLHFGHLSIEAVVERALSTIDRWTPMNLEPRMAGRREGFYTRNADVGAFLDEAITWRDLGYHWHWSRRKDTESFERALPAWALKTLADHADDEREYVYTPAEWEAGATHDPLWNAAQRELVVTGTIHSYLRMLWGKKVIEWSRSPDEAYRTLRSPQQQVRPRRPRPKFLGRHPVVLRALRPSVGARAPGAGPHPLHVVRQHGAKVPPRTLSRLRGQPAQARLIAPSPGLPRPA